MDVSTSIFEIGATMAIYTDRHVSSASSFRVKPLVWLEGSQDSCRVFRAETEFGKFCYGTDAAGQPYHQHHGTPPEEVDHRTEEYAKAAAERRYEDLVFKKIAAITLPADNWAHPGLHSYVEQLRAMLQGYADDCERARASLGEPVAAPANPITEETARKIASMLSKLNGSPVAQSP